MVIDKELDKLLERKIQLERELAAYKCKDNFYEFCVYMDADFFTPDKPHLKMIADAFQEIADGKIKKLAVSLPPRAGKSYTTSLFCAWQIGRNPTGGIMRNSYAAELAESFSYHIRDIVKSDKYLKIFPDIRLKKDKQAVNDWALETAKQTTYFCAGVGGAITVYNYMKLYACGKSEFEYPIALALKYTSKPTFIKARDELIREGFIEFVHHNRVTKIKNVYKFSAKWQANKRPIPHGNI